MASIVEPNNAIPAAPLLHALGLSRATFYRFRATRKSAEAPSACEPVEQNPSDTTREARSGTAAPTTSHTRSCPVPGRSLSPDEREAVRQTLYGQRFMDATPTEVFTTLLDEGTYLCSIRTMYRLLKADHANQPRRRTRRHPHYQTPELLATRANQLWSWDITRLKGPRPWSYYFLYVILDVFSRYVVGWMVAHQESQALARQLLDEACHRQRIEPGQLTIHADRGAAMTSKSVALLLSDLGVLRTHSRPHVSNDNPYSEAHFKTLKYMPDFPARFGSIEHARSVCADLLHWYNGEHHHAGLALLTPATVHHGFADHVIARRQARLDEAYARLPQRFVNRPPKHPVLPQAVWINAPKAESASEPKGELITP